MRRHLPPLHHLILALLVLYVAHRIGHPEALGAWGGGGKAVRRAVHRSSGSHSVGRAVHRTYVRSTRSSGRSNILSRHVSRAPSRSSGGGHVRSARHVAAHPGGVAHGLTHAQRVTNVKRSLAALNISVVGHHSGASKNAIAAILTAAHLTKSFNKLNPLSKDKGKALRQLVSAAKKLEHAGYHNPANLAQALIAYKSGHFHPVNPAEVAHHSASGDLAKIAQHFSHAVPGFLTRANIKSSKGPSGGSRPPGAHGSQWAIVKKAAHKAGISPRFLWGVYGTETNFGHNTNTSSAGAVGPFQFLPSTARGLGINPYNFKSAAYGAAKYLAQAKHGGEMGMVAHYYGAPSSTYLASVHKYGGYPASAAAGSSSGSSGSSARVSASAPSRSAVGSRGTVRAQTAPRASGGASGGSSGGGTSLAGITGTSGAGAASDLRKQLITQWALGLSRQSPTVWTGDPLKSLQKSSKGLSGLINLGLQLPR